MKISVDALLKDCPEKLLALYPQIIQQITLWQDTPDWLKNEIDPLIIAIEGSRSSGKSEFIDRTTVSASYDGYIRKARFATITEKGLNGCKDIIERLDPDCVGTGVNNSKTSPMYRMVGGARIEFDFFGKFDIKTEQEKYDLMVCEEVENWNSKQGIKALETEIRHCAVIILVSNNLPESIKAFLRVHKAILIRVDYWENKMCPKHIKEAYDRARIEDPSYFENFVMCSAETPRPRWFDQFQIRNFFTENLHMPSLSDLIYTNNGIDVGQGYGDESVIVSVRQNKYKHIYIDVRGKYQLEAPMLAAEVAQQRLQCQSQEEVWDADGIGGTALQNRAPDPRQRQALGVIPFHGQEPAKDNKYFNARSEAYGLWREFMQLNMAHYVGDPIYIAQLKQEMQAQFYAPDDTSKGQQRLAKKDEIKKLLGGESPNIADAVAIAVWRCATRPLTTANNSMYNNIIKTTGAPTTEIY